MSPSIPESTDEWGTRPVVEVSARVRKPGFIHYTITGDPDKESKQRARVPPVDSVDKTNT